MKAVSRWAAGHRKLLAAAIGTALTVALQVWGPGNAYVSLAVLAASTLGVYQLPNRPAPPATPMTPVTSPPSGDVKVIPPQG